MENCFVCDSYFYPIKEEPFTDNNDDKENGTNADSILASNKVVNFCESMEISPIPEHSEETEVPLCNRCSLTASKILLLQEQISHLQSQVYRLQYSLAEKALLTYYNNEDDNSEKAQPSTMGVIQKLLRDRWEEPTEKDNGGGGGGTSTISASASGISNKSVSGISNKSASGVSSINASGVSSINASGVSSSKATESTTKIISITTTKDNTLASVEVSNEDQEVENINEGSITDDEDDNEQIQDDAMVIAMSPTQFCAASEGSNSPDPLKFLQGAESENDLDAEGDDDDANTQRTIRQFRKMKQENNGSVKFPNDLEVTEWSSDDSQQRGLELDYDIFETDDGSQDFDEMGESLSKRRRMLNRESLDMTVDNNSLGNIEFQQNEEGLYVCMFCSKTFIHKYPYRDHLKTHTGEGPRCPVCNKIFPKNHNLMLHMRTHTGEKPYKCMVCGKGFADKSNLKVHMRVHTGERPYKCEYCDQAFVNSSRLVVHRRLHTGEKPFMCDLCNRCFGTSNQLQTHRKIHYEDKGYKCNECGKSYTSATTLQAHVALVH